jgi:hypothetical protein
MLPPVSRSILTYLNAELANPRARTGEAIRVALNLDRHGSLQALEGWSATSSCVNETTCMS